MSDFTVTGPNPHRVGACPSCGSYRSDGRPPYLHYPGCPSETDAQIGRWLRELEAGDFGGPVLRCTDPGHDHGAEARMTADEAPHEAATKGET